MTSLKTEFNSPLSTRKLAVEDLAQQDKFFMVLTLTAFNPKLDSVLDHIMASVVIPSLDEVFT